MITLLMHHDQCHKYLVLRRVDVVRRMGRELQLKMAYLDEAVLLLGLAIRLLVKVKVVMGGSL